MKHYIIASFTVAVLLIALAGPAHASCSGLVLIPTADIVPHRQIDVALEIDGLLEKFAADTRLVNTQLGLWDRLEVGVDFDLSEGADSMVFLNGKLLLAASKDGETALATGITNISNKQKALPYFVLSHCFGDWRAHLGAMRIEHTDELMVGADWAVGDRWMLMADHTTGDDNYSSAGVFYSTGDCSGVLAGVYIPNSGDDNILTLQYCFSGKL